MRMSFIVAAYQGNFDRCGLQTKHVFVLGIEGGGGEGRGRVR